MSSNSSTTENRDGAGAELAHFAATLCYETIPAPVRARIMDLFVDWFSSALAGKGARPVQVIEHVARTQAETGPAEIIPSRGKSTPLVAAMVNAAASHVAEQDDVHNGSVFHPATVVFPAVLAIAQERGCSGRDLLTAAVAGYETGIRVGEFLGRSHYKVFHTTGTAGTLAAAAAAGRLVGLDARAMVHAFGSAGTQAAGLWAFLRTAADSKQLHTAKAAFNGMFAAYLAEKGFTGAPAVLEGAQGMAAGMSSDAERSKLVDRLGERWGVLETSFKYHASCRHTHPAADALLQIVEGYDLTAAAITAVTAHVHRAALDVLGPVIHPATAHQAKFSMGTVLAMIAHFRRAGVEEFERHFQDPCVVEFRQRVRMQLDDAVDAAYPARWLGRVTVRTTDGRELAGAVDEPKGDPGNTLSRSELREKALRLAEFSGSATAEEVERTCQKIWSAEQHDRFGYLLR